jgi:hypothetical protein
MRCTQPLRLPEAPSAVDELLSSQHPALIVKRALPIFFFVLLVPIFELACLRLPIMDWFYFHLGLVLAVLIAGAALWSLRRSRFSRLLLSAGTIAAVAGVGTYFLYPFFESSSSSAASGSEAVAHALAHTLSPIFYAGIAMALGLFVGWLPAWLHLRSTDVA